MSLVGNCFSIPLVTNVICHYTTSLDTSNFLTSFPKQFPHHNLPLGCSPLECLLQDYQLHKMASSYQHLIFDTLTLSIVING